MDEKLRLPNGEVVSGEVYRRIYNFARRRGMKLKEFYEKDSEAFSLFLHGKKQPLIKTTQFSETKKREQFLIDEIYDKAILKCIPRSQVCAILNISTGEFDRKLSKIRERMRLAAEQMRQRPEELLTEFVGRYQDRVGLLHTKVNTGNEIADVLAIKELRENDKDHQAFLQKSGVLKSEEKSNASNILLQIMGIGHTENQGIIDVNERIKSAGGLERKETPTVEKEIKKLKHSKKKADPKQ